MSTTARAVVVRTGAGGAPGAVPAGRRDLRGGVVRGPAARAPRPRRPACRSLGPRGPVVDPGRSPAERRDHRAGDRGTRGGRRGGDRSLAAGGRARGCAVVPGAHRPGQLVGPDLPHREPPRAAPRRAGGRPRRGDRRRPTGAPGARPGRGSLRLAAAAGVGAGGRHVRPRRGGQAAHRRGGVARRRGAAQPRGPRQPAQVRPRGCVLADRAGARRPGVGLRAPGVGLAARRARARRSPCSAAAGAPPGSRRRGRSTSGCSPSWPWCSPTSSSAWRSCRSCRSSGPSGPQTEKTPATTRSTAPTRARAATRRARPCRSPLAEASRPDHRQPTSSTAAATPTATATPTGVP